MDYSLLFGVHFCDDIPGDAALSATCTEAESPDGTWMMNGQRPFIRLGGNMPARRAEHRVGFSQQNESVRTGVGPRYGGGGISPSPSISLSAIPPQTRIMGGSGEVFNVILYFGIIDILLDYDISKRIEHAYKSWQVDPTSISAVDPNS